MKWFHVSRCHAKYSREFPFVNSQCQEQENSQECVRQENLLLKATN